MKRPPSNSLLIRALIGAFLFFLAWAGLRSVTVPLLWPNDEPSHLAYTYHVADGRLPTIDTPIPRGRAEILDKRLRRDDLWGYPHRLDVLAASHPPLYYAAIAPTVMLGDAAGEPELGMRLARLATVGMGAITVAAVGWLAYELAPRSRRIVAIGAAAVAASNPSVLYFSSLIHNDMLAAALSTVGLAFTARAMRSGVRRRDTILAGLSVGAATLTRLTSAPVVLVASAGFAIAAWRRVPRPDQLRGALVAAGTVLGSALAVSAWFYVRNYLLYGDLTATQALLDKVDRVARPRDLLDQLTLGRYWVRLTDQWWGRIASEKIFGGWLKPAIRTITVILIVLALAWLVRSLRARELSGRSLSTICLFGSLPIMLLLANASFVIRGGSPNARYLLPALGLVATGVAIVVVNAAGRWASSAVAGLILVMLAVDVGWYVRLLHREALGFKVGGITAVLDQAGVPAAGPVLVGIAIVAVVGLLLMLRGLAGPGEPADARTPL